VQVNEVHRGSPQLLPPQSTLVLHQRHINSPQPPPAPAQSIVEGLHEIHVSTPQLAPPQSTTKTGGGKN
jgi:hypothetical protein